MADEQDPPVLAPKYRGDPAATSLLYDSDFYLTKPTTDVLLHGHAYAPGGKPATQVDVTMRVGEVRKTLRVTGDRPYQKSAFGLRARAGAAVHPDAADVRAGLRRRGAEPARRTRTGRGSRTATRSGLGSLRRRGSRPRTSSTPG